MPATNTKSFVFNNQPNGLYQFVTDVITYTEQYSKVSEGTQAKMKMILVELLTNAIKHAGQSVTTLKVELTGGNVVIRKTDTGNTLAIRNGNGLLEWPLPGVHHSGNIITIYNNGGAVLKAKLQDNSSLGFFVEEMDNTNPIDIHALPEHFGLMIITQASEAFSYRFDVDNCTNNFIVSISAES